MAGLRTLVRDPKIKTRILTFSFCFTLFQSWTKSSCEIQFANKEKKEKKERVDIYWMKVGIAYQNGGEWMDGLMDAYDGWMDG